jgi:nitroreductase
VSRAWAGPANAVPAVADRPDMTTATGTTAGRHHRRRPRGRALLDTAARAGSLVALAALLVLAGAAGGAADGVPAPEPATTVTFDGGR